jgi:hypothetical protein
VQADFFLRRMREMIEADPALAKEQPFKAIAENDQDFLATCSNTPRSSPRVYRGHASRLC